MDDLSSLDWGQPAQSNGAEQSSYNFDALLRTMPAHARPSAPPARRAEPKKQTGEDAFSSLLPTSFSGAVRPAAASGAVAPRAAPVQPVHHKSPKSIWDLDTLDTLGNAAAPSKTTDASHASFDLLGDFAAPSPAIQETDDLLGALSLPVAKQRSPRSSPQEQAASPPPSLRAAGKARARSPPPHIVGQLVEMGFAPDAARDALARTETGVDIEAAAAALIDQEQRQPPCAVQSAPASHRQEETVQRAEYGADWQKQADQLYAQASMFGTSMLKNANALWGSAKAQAQKALDDGHTSSAAGVAVSLGQQALRRMGNVQSGRQPVTNGKPRWMQTAGAHSNGHAEAPDFQALAAEHKQPLTAQRAKPSQKATLPAKPSPSQPAQTAQKPLEPVITLERTLPTDARASIDRAMLLKKNGNKAFQRGAYGDAEEQYTQALAMLETSSLWRIPLLNNRANVRLKNGDSQGAIADTTASIAILVIPSTPANDAPNIFRPSREASLPLLYASLNLREAYTKSVAQRAHAYEACEKWTLAKQDWTCLYTYEREEGSSARSGDANRRAANEGMRRCDAMLYPPPKPAAKPAAPCTAKAAQQASDAGVARVRAQRIAQEAEDAERLQHKDSVESRLGAWSAGKQKNVRALLASIDDPSYHLLWPELQWKK
ncbi:hypothetical protein MVES_002200 [Malassezia vespertilionis]|uniref:UBA domain-containing protein n=2 Tax=Malassezia vespertilionis TaxID=2020962 RepID=A0A2N1JCA2_9BASI|nr:hypothetical protein MVES_002200 [Malassezia vespertilionis]